MSKLDDLHPDLRKRIRALQKAAPWPIGITSGYRSTQRQRELWEAWQRRDPGANPANRPGTSKHERTLDGKPAAEAVDLDFPGARGSKAHTEAVRWVHGNAHLFGLHFPIRSEDWHAESNGRPFDPEEDALAGISEARLAEMFDDLALTVTGGVRRPDKKDTDVKHVSNADLLTALERGFDRVVKAIKEKP